MKIATKQTKFILDNFNFSGIADKYVTQIILENAKELKIVISSAMVIQHHKSISLIFNDKKLPIRTF